MTPFLLAIALAGRAPQDQAAPAAVAPYQLSLDEAAHALAEGRLEQAKLLIADAVSKGASGDRVDRLVADLTFSDSDFERALPMYRALLAGAPDDPILLERGGISALRLGQGDEARSLLARGAMIAPGRWATFNALGVLADRVHDYDAAEAAYAEALMRAPQEAKILNNLGWSRLLRGAWTSAVEPLERAVAIAPGFATARNNLELARAALAADLPARRPGEADSDYAMRLNDAGVVAGARGERARAIAAFTRAINLSSHWYEKAADNLAAIEGDQ